MGDLEGAISQFRAAIALAPSYAPAHFHLAEACRERVKQRKPDRNFNVRRSSIRRLKRVAINVGASVPLALERTRP